MSVSSNSMCMCVWEGRWEREKEKRKEKRKKTECGRKKNVKK